MVQTALEVRLGGAESGIAAHTYTAVLGQLTRALEEIDRVVEPSMTARPVWKVTDTDWRTGVGAVVRLSPDLRDRMATQTTHDLHRPIYELWGGVKRLASEPEIPEAFTASIVERFSKVRHQINSSTGLTNVAVLPVGEQGAPAEFDEAFGVNAEKATAAASLAYGSLSGRLDLISARGRRRRIGLRADYGPAVMCDVESLDQGLYMDAFEKRVLVIGTLKRNARGQVVSIMADDLQIIPNVERVAVRHLLGAFPELGGKLSATEYVRQQRGEN